MNQTLASRQHFSSEKDVVSKIATMIEEATKLICFPIKVSDIPKANISEVWASPGVYFFTSESNQGAETIYIGGAGAYSNWNGTLGSRCKPASDGRSFGHEKYRKALEMGYENLKLYVYPMKDRIHIPRPIGTEMVYSIITIEDTLIRFFSPILNECHNNQILKHARADERRELFLSRVRSYPDGCSFSCARQGIGWNHADQICKDLIMEGLITECRMRNGQNVMCRMLFPIGR